MYKNVKYFIGPMTKNIVDASIEFSNSTGIPLGLILSRRQIEFNGGYVNNWTTQEFSNYVKSKTNNIVLVRDHAGPNQGQQADDGYESLTEDCKYLDIIHIDPWVKYPSFLEGVRETIKMINYCYNINPNILYEIGTEESIRRFEIYELDELVKELKNALFPEIFNQIKYLVIQSGTSLKGTNQTGNYNTERLKQMLVICKKHNLIAKEHNGDYIPVSIIKEKMNLGLDCINIAPEFGLIETQEYLNNIDEESFLLFWEICYNSKKWCKWVNTNFDPIKEKYDLVKICGHYVISYKEFFGIMNKFSYINNQIRDKVIYKLNELHR